MDALTPSVFAPHFPSSSICRKREAEIVASNTMVIRAKLGNKWTLTWSEYKRERIEHGADFTESEKPWFEEVMRLTSNPVDAIAFAAGWTTAAKKALKIQEAA